MEEHVESTKEESLRKDLETLSEEKDELQQKYSALLTKVTNLRNSLGKKLQEDAEELDKREIEINSLQEEIASLQSVNSTLQTELESSASECTSLTDTLSATTSSLTSTQSELRSTNNDLKRLQSDLRSSEIDLSTRNEELERMRIERDEWEQEAEQCRVEVDEAKTGFNDLVKDAERFKIERSTLEEERDREREEKMNLSSVLADFQDSRDTELKNAVRDLESQLNSTTQSLAEWKSRGLNAELTLESSQSSSTRVTELESQVKEKTALVNKLRHEAVILNSHLTEALRRLRSNTTSLPNNVDRRLVSNMVIQFLTIPRADTKRFEVLALLGTILEWNDSERERAGLARSHNNSLTPNSTGTKPSFWSSRGSTSTTDLTASGKTDSGIDESESFSKLWVEFLLTESGGASAPLPPPPQQSTPPTSPIGRLSMGSNSGGSRVFGGRRLSSFSSQGTPGE